MYVRINRYVSNYYRARTDTRFCEATAVMATGALLRTPSFYVSWLHKDIHIWLLSPRYQGFPSYWDLRLETWNSYSYSSYDATVNPKPSCTRRRSCHNHKIFQLLRLRLLENLRQLWLQLLLCWQPFQMLPVATAPVFAAPHAQPTAYGLR